MNYWIFGRRIKTESRIKSFGAHLLRPGQLTLLGVGPAEKEQECLHLSEISGKIVRK